MRPEDRQSSRFPFVLARISLAIAQCLSIAGVVSAGAVACNVSGIQAAILRATIFMMWQMTSRDMHSRPKVTISANLVSGGIPAVFGDYQHNADPLFGGYQHKYPIDSFLDFTIFACNKDALPSSCDLLIGQEERASKTAKTPCRHRETSKS